MTKDGEIEAGTILVIEAMDRLTRQSLGDAIPLFIGLLNSGIELVTLQDRQHYSKESLKDLAKFITAIILLSGGNRESENKSERVRDAYEANRKRGSSQIFGSAPGWVVRKDKFSPWELHPEKSKVVRQVFELMAGGYGSGEIAKRANSEGWIVPTRLGDMRAKGWTATMASKIVRSRSAIGEHEHRNRTREANNKHWEGESRGIVIPNYYPAVVDEELFYKVQAAVDKRRKPQGRDKWYFNIWSGLICCGKCGGGGWRKTDFGTKTFGQLRCRNAAAGLCDEPSIPIKQVDRTVLEHISRHSSRQLGDMDSYVAKLDAETAKLEEIDAGARYVARAIAKGIDLPAVFEEAASLSQQRAEVANELERLRKLISEHSGTLFDTSFADTLAPYLYVRSENAKEQRAKANLMLRRLIIDKVELIASESRVAVTYKETGRTMDIDVSKVSPDTHIRTSEDDDRPFPVNPFAPNFADFVPDEVTARRLKKLLASD